MIKHEFYLKSYKWKVIAFYDVIEEDEDKILEILILIGCRKPQLEQAMINIEDGMMDNGFTYSNFNLHLSVVVIGYGSIDAEAMNTLVHEARHVELHISSVYEINEYDEERYYLMGKLVLIMYSKFKRLL